MLVTRYEGSEKCGNKGRNLFRMKEEGLNVPDLAVLDSDSYREFVEANAIGDKIGKILEEMTPDNIGKSSEELDRLFDGLSLGPGLVSELSAVLKEGKLYAVRSSGVLEDLDDHSFAGQYKTFLNTSLEDVPARVIDCYKSMFTPTILSYLNDNNIKASSLAMSVVIQEMVASDVSGICFTVNPQTGDDKEMYIEVAEGLGEDLVSGRVKPDAVRYDRYNDLFLSKSDKLAEKVYDQMAESFEKIMQIYGFPCDIEFAVKDDVLYILQSRKITTLRYGEIEDIWTTADFKDGGVSASVCTPYMWSLYEYIWEHSLRKFIIDSKILKDSEMPLKLGEMFYARCYWNLSVVKKAMSRVVGYKEREFDNEYGIRITYEGDGETTGITPASLFRIARMAIAQKKIVKERNENKEYLKADLLAKYETYRKNYDEGTIGDIKSVWYKLIKEHYLYSETTYFWQIFINTIHQSLYKDGLLKYVSEADYLTLLSTLENISHMLPFYDMWKLSREIRKSEDEMNFMKSNDDESIAELLKSDKKGTALDGIRDVIAKYGYHSDKELDVTYPCYYEDPRPIIENVRDMLDLDDKFSPENDREEGVRKYTAILERIKAEYPGKYKKIKGKIDGMRKMLWWREEFRDLSTRLYYIIRVYTVKLAEALVAEGTLEKADDIWFLKIADLFAFLDGKFDKEDLRKIIARNLEYYNSFRNYMSENEIGTVFDGSEHRITADIKGLGANNGRVTGVARVIEDFSEIDRLQKGDILVTRFTDTGWTPKFAILKGIVTEYGGILCHAAIVSREYGIPAIVCCHDAMQKINDGEIITIDGATGVVIKGGGEA